MRRSCTPSLITEDGKLAPLTRVQFGDKRIAEDMLQHALHANPGLIPVDEIDSSYGPLVSLGREIAAIDNLFVSPAGRLALVETKLWRNPESLREVVGQILDYAAEISTWSYADLEAACRDAVDSPLAKGRTLYQHVAGLYPNDVPAEDRFADEVHRSLTTSRFLLLVVGDGIREGVERVLGALHEHPQRLFTFGLVEVQIYENPKALAGRLFVPQVVAKTTEVVRAVVRVQTTGKAEVNVAIEETASEPTKQGRRTLSEEVFFSELPDETSRLLFKRLLSFADEMGMHKRYRSQGVSLRLPDPKGSKSEITFIVLNTSGEVYAGWMMDQLDAIGLPMSIGERFVKSLCSIIGDVSPQKEDPDFLSRNLNASEVAAKYDLVTQLVRDTVKDIGEAAGA